jgi:ATP-dependent DNA helicase RecG
MRPAILDPLFQSNKTLPSVGPKIAVLLEKLAGPRVLDLCWHLPSQIEERTLCPALRHGVPDTLATLVVTVEAHQPPKTRGRPYRVVCHDGGTEISLLFFNANTRYLKAVLPVDQKRLISGKIEKSFGLWQMIHPHHIGRPEEASAWTGTRAIYPLTTGLSKKVLGNIIEHALKELPALPEWISEDLLKAHGWAPWRETLVALHHPKTSADIDPASPARQRLAFDELMAYHLTLKLLQQTQTKTFGLILKEGDDLIRSFLSTLPFQLTKGQQAVFQDIQKDLESGTKMVRLLQGDVGSGKTVVAFMAMVKAIGSGHQAALLAPTEILARQHYQTLKSWSESLGISLALFTSNMTPKERRVQREALAAGQLSLAVGTHALLEEAVTFQSLGLAVIDEQHRFGVDQRSQLVQKGPHAHTLVMTATPIPRTLALSFYGEVSVSNLREKPAERKPIETRLVPLDRLDEIYNKLRKIIDGGEQIYWVCPLVEEGEERDGEKALGHVEKRYNKLRALFKGQVGFVHGRLSAQEKEETMAAFKAGRLKILVATTVIEVGVDVPNATVMIIENAEQFGLFQLHQLRGRVGRGGTASTCLLLYKTPLSTTAQERLKILRETNDGFKIAEMDLKIRGSGDFLGTRQSGLPGFRFFRFDTHFDLFKKVEAYVQEILDQHLYKDKDFREALRCLLSLFQHDDAHLLLKGG